MSELTLLLLRTGFLILMWSFVFALIYSLRADLFGVRARKIPDSTAEAAAAPAIRKASATAGSPDALTEPVHEAPRAAMKAASGAATTDSVSKIVITSGPKAGLEIALTDQPLTIGRSRESGLVIRDDYTSSHHARLVLWGNQWMVQDLDSTNGTWHDGTRVASPVAIRAGATVKVGATTFELRK